MWSIPCPTYHRTRWKVPPFMGPITECTVNLLLSFPFLTYQGTRWKDPPSLGPITEYIISLFPPPKKLTGGSHFDLSLVLPTQDTVIGTSLPGDTVKDASHPGSYPFRAMLMGSPLNIVVSVHMVLYVTVVTLSNDTSCETFYKRCHPNSISSSTTFGIFCILTLRW